MVTLRDASERLPYRAKTPDDWESRKQAGNLAMKEAKSAVNGGDPASEQCPPETTLGPTVDWSLLTTDESSYDASAPLFNGPEYANALKADVETNEGKETWVRFYDRAAKQGVVAVRQTDFRQATGGGGTKQFEGGHVAGTVYVIKADRIVCQAAFTAQSSELILEGEQTNDLRNNQRAAIREALTKIR